MTDRTKAREVALRLALVLRKRFPDLAEKALLDLVTEAERSPAAEEYVLGLESHLDLEEAVSFARGTSLGALIVQHAEGVTSQPVAVDHIRATEGMSPRQALSYARKHRLG